MKDVSQQAVRLQCVNLAARLLGEVEVASDPPQLIMLAQLIQHYVATGTLNTDLAQALAAGLEDKVDDMVSDISNAVSRLEAIRESFRDDDCDETLN